MENIEHRLSLVESKIDQLSKDIKNIDNNQRSSFDSINRAIARINDAVSYISRK